MICVCRVCFAFTYIYLIQSGLGKYSDVDPIVASFSGGAVGVISSLMVVEFNNVKQQEHKRCRYCHGTGIELYSYHFCVP